MPPLSFMMCANLETILTREFSIIAAWIRPRQPYEMTLVLTHTGIYIDFNSEYLFRFREFTGCSSRYGATIMQMINRDCLTIYAKQAFVDWIHSVPELEFPDVTLDEVNIEGTVLLVPEGYSRDDALTYLADFEAALTERFFADWYADESVWPDLERFPFDHWFSVTYHSMIFDMAVGVAITKDSHHELMPEWEGIDIGPYKQQIIDEFDRHGDWGVPQDPNMVAALRAINEFTRLSGEAAGILDLQLTMVESGTGFTLRYGDISEPFYEALEMVLADFTTLLKEHPSAYDEIDFNERLTQLVQNASQVGWGFGDYLRDKVQEIQSYMDDYLM